MQLNPLKHEIRIGNDYNGCVDFLVDIKNKNHLRYTHQSPNAIIKQHRFGQGGWGVVHKNRHKKPLESLGLFIPWRSARVWPTLKMTERIARIIVS